MFPRDWILETLAGLAVWYWPIFFWEMLRIERYCARRRAAGKAELIGIGVTRKGRIHIISRMAGDTPDPADWTQFAPRAPWAKLDLGALAVEFAADTPATAAASYTFIRSTGPIDRFATGFETLDPG
ncbi:MAG: hypothetical protein RLN72_12160 [Henriciella sp.]